MVSTPQAAIFQKTIVEGSPPVGTVLCQETETAVRIPK